MMQLRFPTILATTAAFVALDAVWLGAMGSRLYRPAIGHLMAADVDWIAAALFYAVYLAGLLGFAVMPSKDIGGAALRGALFGFVAYATYDLTSQATLRDWPWIVTGVDLGWGTFASAVACAAGAAVSKRRL
ncbi:MAG TPA: DUF2177 family protein [Ramlibacter sp.]